MFIMQPMGPVALMVTISMRGNHGGDQEGGQGPEDEAAHGDDDVLGIVAQEALDGGMRK